MNKKVSTPKSSAHGIKWNLKDLYGSITDSAIENDLKKALQSAEKFEKKYKGKMGAKPPMTAVQVVAMVKELEEILILRDKPHIYAHLLFAQDTQNPDYGKLLQKMQTRSTEIQKHLIFFDLEWCAVDDKIASKIIADKASAFYRHYLAALRRYRPHLLSEPEEKIIDDLRNTGARAFVRLFDEMLGAAKFHVKIKGKIKEMSEQEALSLLYDPNRDNRKSAAEGLTSGFDVVMKPLTFIFNNLVQDHSTMDRLRKHKNPIDGRNLANEIDAETVEALLKTCDQNTGLVSRYYTLKAKLLGLKKLYDYDRYAPISADLPSCTWQECRELVTESYNQFSSKLGQIVDEFFTKNWIDAELRPGKRGGAFSAGTTPDVHPYILVNFNDRLRDVGTVAHELGHGVHQYLSRPQGYINGDTPLTLAETASVFGEMITFHNMLARQRKPQVKLALICSKIEDAFATVFRQACMTRFEQKLHDARKQGELTPEAIGDLWYKANQAMFGDSVMLTEGYKKWWCYISHFTHTPFYCYAYAFGELLVLSLYAQYRKEGKAFVPKYLELLSAGGSDKPENLAMKVGIDITKPSFWKGGMHLISEMIDDAEKLAGEIGPAKTAKKKK